VAHGFVTFFKQIFTEGVSDVLAGFVELKNQVKTPANAVSNKMNDLRGALDLRRRLQGDEITTDDVGTEESRSGLFADTDSPASVAEHERDALQTALNEQKLLLMVRIGPFPNPSDCLPIQD